MGFRLLMRKLFSLPSGRFRTLRLTQTKCWDFIENILNEYLIFTVNFFWTFRVPLLNHQQSSNSNYRILEFARKVKIFSFSRVFRISFPFGFSSRMMFLLWCVLGGVLLHFFECNILEILLKPNYEKPVETVQDVVDRRLTIVWPPFWTWSLVETMKNSSSEVERARAELVIIPEVVFCYTEKFLF